MYVVSVTLTVKRYVSTYVIYSGRGPVLIKPEPRTIGVGVGVCITFCAEFDSDAPAIDSLPLAPILFSLWGVFRPVVDASHILALGIALCL